MKSWYNNLPISQYADTIASELNSNGKCILTSPTGTGKTIYLPYFLLYAVTGINRVIVSQPRVSQAESNSASAIDGSGQSTLIGHITGRGTSSNKQAQILYVTEGILTSMLEKEDFSSTLVIIDEAHELEFSTISNLYKVKELGTKVLVMSATVQGSMFADYLNCNVVEATTTSFSVKGSPVFGTTNTSSDLSSTVTSYLQEGYNFIAICPGKKEIAEVQTMVESYMSKSQTKVAIYLMHGELDSKDRMAYLQHKEGQAVIIATNIGRTGLTYPAWIKGVIDLGEIKHMVNNKGVKELTTFQVSKAEVAQAAGRIGRIELEEGSLPYKYTLIGSYDYRKDYPLRSIDLLDEREFAINTISQGIENSKLITPFDEVKYNRVIEELRTNNVINNDNQFTEKGKKIAPLLTMLEYSQALILYYAMNLGIAKEVIKFLAIEAYTKFGTVVDKKADDSAIDKFFSSFVSSSYANIKLFDTVLDRMSLKNKKRDLQNVLSLSNSKVPVVGYNFSKVREELSQINKELAKEAITFYMAEQEALEGYRKLSSILYQLGYKKDTQKVTEKLVSVVVVAAKGCPSYRIGRDNKVSSYSNTEEKYYSNSTGTVTTIQRATFLTNVTYFDQEVVELVFKLDSSLFTKDREFNSDDTKVTVYELGNCEVRVSTPLTVEDIHTKAVNSISLYNYQSQIQEVNTKLELLGEDKVVLEINTVPTFTTVEEQKSLIVESLEKSIEDIINHYSYLNDILPQNYKGYDVSYSNGRIVLTVDSLSNFTSLPLQLEGIDLFYAYDGYSSLSYSDLSQKYDRYLANIQEELEKETVLKSIESYVDYPKVDFNLYVDGLLDSFTREWNGLIGSYIYTYIVREGNLFFWKKTIHECTADMNKELFKQMIATHYENQNFEYSLGDMYDYLEEVDTDNLTTKQSELCEQLDKVLDTANGSYSVCYYHNKAIKLYRQILADSKPQESDLAAMLKKAMLG